MQKEPLLLIDKPKGITSFDVIRALRREFSLANEGKKAPKMGHAGTLDPLATGLMIIGVGEGTKQLKDLLGLSKAYVAEISLGKATDSGDVDGTVVKEMPVPANLSIKEVQKIINGMKGEHELPVSLFSAIKRAGRPLYTYAHKGEKVEQPIRKMKVNKAELISFSGDKIVALFDVESGTYVRSLAEEVGKRLGTCAHIANLRRLSIGPFKVEYAASLSKDIGR